MLPTLSHAVNWRQHLSHCNWDEACAKEQARARKLWNEQSWDDDLKGACYTQHLSSTYIMDRDYVAAVDCVYALQSDRNIQEAIKAQTERDLAEASLARERAERARENAELYLQGAPAKGD
jgi:hypothetical protein